MPEDNGTPTDTPKGSNVWDVLRELIRMVRDIFNDWRAWIAFLFVCLLVGGAFAGDDILAAIESWIRAWRGTQ